MKISAKLDAAIRKVLVEIGINSDPRYLESVSGGCINECIHLKAGHSDFFLKFNLQVFPGMFSAEAKGLQHLAATQLIRVPQLYAVSDGSEDAPAFLLLEWIEKQPNFDQSLLGEQLANMHLLRTSGQFGFDQDGYIGSNPQFNGWMSDWIDFFRERRLRPQVHMASDSGHLPSQRQAGLEKLMSSLEKWLAGIDHYPALLHGDLWGGNVIAAAGGQPVLIDPAVYYGDREAELAFTGLFGGFSERFYQAYQSVYPLEEGYQDRFRIYNLYHLLNHLNLFGEGYGARIDQLLKRYIA